jgi:hypothetical protein
MKKMENIRFKKEKTTFIVFPCINCKQYMYVKETQKTKKCLRCGFSHQVSTIKNSGDHIKGMTKAVETVIKNQEKLAIDEYGILPEFRTSNDFIITKKKSSISKVIIKNDKEVDNISKFKKLLLEISKSYSEFPLYVIELKAESYGLKGTEIKKLIRKLEKQGQLIKGKKFNNYRVKL